jgi:hypothetical protein
MVRTLLCSLAGAVSGFVAGLAVVVVTAGPQPHSDTGPFAMLVGVFLAGAGAIAGAVIGGVADLIEFSKRKDRARRETQDRNE